MSNNNAVFLTAQQDMDVEDPGFKDLYAYGVVAEVKQVLRVSDELVKVLVEQFSRRPSGGARGIIAKFRYEVKPCFAKKTRRI